MGSLFGLLEGVLVLGGFLLTVHLGGVSPRIPLRVPVRGSFTVPVLEDFPPPRGGNLRKTSLNPTVRFDRFC